MVRHSIYPIFAIIALILLIELICKGTSVPEYIFPAPSIVFIEMSSRIGVYLYHTAITLAESVVGFIIAVTFAFLIGVTFVHSQTIEKSFYPITVALKAVPIVALAPLIIVWCGAGFSSKVIMAALVCFFPVVVGVTSGMKSATQEMHNLFTSLGASKWQILWKLRLPVALPQIFSALKISAALSVVGAIVAELSGSLQGIGYIILMASYEVQTARIIVGVINAGLIGILMFNTVSAIEKKYLNWHESISEI